MLNVPYMLYDAFAVMCITLYLKVPVRLIDTLDKNVTAVLAKYVKRHRWAHYLSFDYIEVQNVSLHSSVVRALVL